MECRYVSYHVEFHWKGNFLWVWLGLAWLGWLAIVFALFSGILHLWGVEVAEKKLFLSILPFLFIYGVCEFGSKS